MQISGKFLPALPCLSGECSGQSLSAWSQAQLELYQDTEQQNRQQTVEYVFRSELVLNVILAGVVFVDRRSAYRYIIVPA